MTSRGVVRSGVFTGAGVLRVAAWFGLATGFMEVLARGIQHFVLRSPIYVSYHMVWMAPLADVTFFVLVGLLLLGVHRMLRRPVGARSALTVFAVLLLLGPALNFPRIHWAAGLVLVLGVSVQGARWVAPRFDVFRRFGAPLGVAMAIVAVLVGVGMTAGSALAERRAVAGLPAARAGAPNVLLLILDTVRAANLGLYGYERPTTRNLERLAERGVVFDRAMVTAPWTLPSHGSMFTGRDAYELATNWRSPLSTRYPTVAEALAAHGYVAGGFVANLLYGQREFRLNRGFHHYEDFPIALETVITSSWIVRYTVANLRRLLGARGRVVSKSAEDVVDGFLDWPGGHPDRTGRPFFAFLNIMNAHSPYVSPPPFDTMFGADAYTYTLRTDGWTREELAASVAAYDAAITYADHEVGRLVDSLRARGLLENTVLIVASDHGEHFGEQDLLGHANSLYMPLLHVPLLIAASGLDTVGVRVRRTVTLADLPATIFGLAGLTMPPCMSGRSLFAPADGTGRPILAEVRKTINMPAWFPASRGDMHAVVAEPWHYIEHADETTELFEYLRDPLEEGPAVTGPAADSTIAAMRATLRAATVERAADGCG